MKRLIKSLSFLALFLAVSCAHMTRETEVEQQANKNKKKELIRTINSGNELGGFWW